ncbi:hypothetical protein JWH04_12775 [Xanthomonas melonis]|nr:hypothetical protein [Xanthomonas melonis]MCD0245870.1 hypothetical protein [Xanthomonas melonis]MCD0279802.1 hypothetical protein [Xanthomonas melonis]
MKILLPSGAVALALSEADRNAVEGGDAWSFDLHDSQTSVKNPLTLHPHA